MAEDPKDTADRSGSALVEKVLAGNDPRLVRLAAQGLLPLPPEQLLPLQIRLVAHQDTAVAEAARRSLQALPPARLASFVREEASAEIFTHLAGSDMPAPVLEAVLRRRDVPRSLLARMAGELGPELQEILLLRQDAIVEHPPILDALEENPRLSTYSRRRVREYRQHLLPQGRREIDVPEPEAVDEPEEEVEEGEATREEVEAAIAEAAATVEPEGERDLETELSESQIRSLPIPVRLKLARGASRSLRALLIRDSNPRVAVAVLKGGGVSEQEIEAFAGHKTVVSEVLEEISRRREWTNKHAVVINLVHNPRTPPGISVRLVPRLSVRELRLLTKDRNVPDAVRSTARRLYTMKQQ